MKLSKAIAVSCLVAFAFTATAQKPHDPKMDAYVSNLMSKMTIDEKIGQLNLPAIGFDITGPVLSQGVEEKIQQGLVGGVFNTYTPAAVRKLQAYAITKTRLKIPLLFGYDVIHGHKTIFPIPLGLSSSWDLPLIEQTARAAADEASADGLNWVFSPMVDITRDPRWGRVSEGGGEDTWLGSQIAKAMVKGYQGKSFDTNDVVMACVKHFALYGAVEAGRDYNVVDMSDRRMFETYLPTYKAAVDAGAATVMSSFNEINGVPAAANRWLLTDVLRKQWGFDGMVATDYTAIMELMQHGVGNEEQVAKLALEAGNDMDMVSEIFLKRLKQLVDEKKMNVSYIDQACRRVLEAKYKLGLFANPYKFVSEQRAKTQIMNADKLQLAKEAAEKSMVLLKNQNNVLPLKQGSNIAFIGPLVKDQRDLIGNWSGAGDWKKAISVWDALQKQYPSNTFTYAKGCNILDNQALIDKLNPHDAQIVLDSKTPQQLIDEAVSAANKANVAVVFLGEAFGMTGEAASRSDISLPANQVALLKALKATGKPIVLVLMNGRPLTLPWEDANMDAILETWYGGTKAGDAIADVLFGKYNPSGKLSMTFPRSVGQIPIYYSAKNTGRPIDEQQKYTSKYLDIPNTPLYPFGYGLSYTTFSYSAVKLDKTTINADSKLTATVTITNTGKMAGQETVELYVRDMIGSVTRPLKELKGFQKVFLQPGESKTISFNIGTDDLKFYDINMKYTYEPGDFKLFIGTSSQDVKEADFKVE
ncbi:beta-glucosidase BglX [Mucilaginibacter polytrichastri]|uniref:Periplasmic beta-glucosidase n=1 Tax=Mucilaginibacter polytrichastri TaxID=1302689 RepID=A0A1Q5ZYY3_9SPHI|nr:beta-glucosidase BglX [Mucilaginibacter polytrichastri]OKS86952.1 Periplasmic beta-glucosidase [Mucilaginibacter polytrichastri]SFS84873.1 beta-glucosidase [Mucilaginibacter polytrichastri]